jgi:hypothetical protein
MVLTSRNKRSLDINCQIHKTLPLSVYFLENGLKIKNLF